MLAHAPSWEGLRSAHRAKCLALVLGPARGEQVWSAACDRYLQRARVRGRAGGGICLSTDRCLPSRFLSALSFLAQVDEPPSRDGRGSWARVCNRYTQGTADGRPQHPSRSCPFRLPSHSSHPDLDVVTLATKHWVSQWGPNLKECSRSRRESGRLAYTPRSRLPGLVHGPAGSTAHLRIAAGGGNSQPPPT